MSKTRNIDVRIVADSVNPNGGRIVTALWTYPRFIHGEVMTHRVFSRNAASSRAIPIARVIDAVKSDPASPEQWGVAQRGMQAYDVLDRDAADACAHVWYQARDAAVQYAGAMEKLKLAKQVTNRLLEPWFKMTVLVTATEWYNFFLLRAHPDAQPEMQVLAYRMLDALMRSESQPKDWGEWHIPFDPGTSNLNGFHVTERLVWSVAQCARTSYVSYSDTKCYAEQAALYGKLKGSGHWSPFEHQALADAKSERSGNFTQGWSQYRQQLDMEPAQQVSYEEIMNNKPSWVTL